MFAILLWCALSAIQVIFNVILLKNDFPFPLSLTTAKLGVATIFACSSWLLRLRPVPRKWWNQSKRLFPVVTCNTLGLVLNDVSLYSGTILLNQTMRAGQSSTTILLTNLPNTIWSMLPLVLTLGGIHHVISSSIWETCVLVAMTSNVAFSLRGVFSKHILWQARTTPANNFSIITMLSFLLLLPIAYYLEGQDVKTLVVKMPIRDLEILGGKLAVCGLSHFLSIEVAYKLWDPKASPFTLTLYDILRQAVTLVAAILYFQQEMKNDEMLGYGAALIGQLLQSLDQNTYTTYKSSLKKISPRKTKRRA
jgi:hypothetical protein